ncbi:MAG: helix-turn-helix domain-containing protein [Eubacteriales bacterium]|nr:helix-turn-helix domain-containing protein [Eubacteriales bacterium]
MREEEYKFLQKVLYTQGIALHVFEPPYRYLDLFDNGLRAKLYSNFDYGEVLQWMQENLEEGIIYPVQDAFEACYVMIRVPYVANWQGQQEGVSGKQVNERKRARQGENKEAEEAAPVRETRQGADSCYIMAGPYLDTGERPDAARIVEQNGLDLYHLTALREYYNSLAIAKDVSSILYTFFKYYSPDVTFRIEPLQVRLGERSQRLETRIEEENALAMEIIEERYRHEEAMLAAVGRGDQTQSLLLLGEVGRYRVESRNSNTFRNNQNMTLTLNVLFRKAVQGASVHPAHIDEVSASFARRIEVSRSESDLSQITVDMVKRYCHLVRSYSLRGYSELTANVINYIEFHLREPLGLSELAEKFSVNASYLSGQFRRETGETLTGYLNGKRIQRSLLYLSTTGLPVQEIAARVGIYDESYFSRIFKKRQGMTPREYRDSVKRDRASAEK